MSVTFIRAFDSQGLQRLNTILRELSARSGMTDIRRIIQGTGGGGGAGGGASDHGLLTGLSDDDHLLYTRRMLALSGDSITEHGELAGLLDDAHTQYALLAGRSGGQILVGGTGASENLTLRSTSHATKGDVYVDTAALYLGSIEGGESRIKTPTDSALGVKDADQYSAPFKCGGIMIGGTFLNIPATSILDGYIVVDSGVDILMKLGDAAGANKFSIVDSGAVEVAKIDSDGALVLASTAKIGAYTLPATDGSNGQVLKTDGAGAVTWQAESGGNGGTTDSVARRRILALAG